MEGLSACYSPVYTGPDQDKPLKPSAHTGPGPEGVRRTEPYDEEAIAT